MMFWPVFVFCCAGIAWYLWDAWRRDKRDGYR